MIKYVQILCVFFLVFLSGCGVVNTVTVDELQASKHSTTFLLDKPLREIVDEMELFAESCDSVRPEIIPKIVQQEPLIATSASCFMRGCSLYYELSERPDDITLVKAYAVNRSILNDASRRISLYVHQKVCR